MALRTICMNALAAVVVLGATMPALAVCGDAASVSVARDAMAIDARTLRLPDGAHVRLAGVERLGSADETDVRRALGDIIQGQELQIHAADKPDRYGRQVAFVFMSGSKEPLQGALLGQGDLVAAGSVSQKECANYLMKQENAARTAKRGLWNESDAIKSAEMPGDILAQLGRFVVVQGRVSSVRESGATIYVNFGRRWTRDFALTVSKRRLRDFEAAEMKLKSLEGRIVRVRGFVEQRGGPRIEAFEPGQIELVASER